MPSAWILRASMRLTLRSILPSASALLSSAICARHFLTSATVEVLASISAVISPSSSSAPGFAPLPAFLVGLCANASFWLNCESRRACASSTSCCSAVEKGSSSGGPLPSTVARVPPTDGPPAGPPLTVRLCTDSEK